MKPTTLAVLGVALLTVMACSDSEGPAGPVMPDPELAYQKALEAVEREQAIAREKRNEWVSAQRFMDRAAEFAAAGDYDEAVRMLGLAHAQYKLAIQQAEHEATAWQARTLR